MDKELIVLIGGIAAVIFGVAFGGNAYSKYQCNNFSDMTGKETKYVTFDACYINTDAGWQRWDEYKMRAVASEALSQQ